MVPLTVVCSTAPLGPLPEYLKVQVFGVLFGFTAPINRHLSAMGGK